jgi:hypothetical protein
MGSSVSLWSTTPGSTQKVLLDLVQLLDPGIPGPPDSILSVNNIDTIGADFLVLISLLLDSDFFVCHRHVLLLTHA